MSTRQNQTSVRPSAKPNEGRRQRVWSDIDKDREAGANNTNPGFASTRFTKGSRNDSSDTASRRKHTAV